MSDEIEAAKEIAGAAREIAKAGGIALETAQELGGFLSRMFGSVPEDIVGVIGGDWLRHARTRTAAGLAQKTTQILEERGILERTVPVSPSVALPILEAAQDEAREELQEIWARLLANAMDPDRCSRVRRPVIEVVKQLEPEDVVALDLIHFTLNNMENIRPASERGASLDTLNKFANVASFLTRGQFTSSGNWDLPKLAIAFEPMAPKVEKLTENDLHAAFDHIQKLGCVPSGSHNMYEPLKLTPLARQVVEACKP